MSRTAFGLIVAAVVIVAFLAMWLGWRARARRDAGVLASSVAPVGELIAEFSRVLYVSTTPVGEPLSRVAAPGLRYRGQAEIVVLVGGVTVAVVGEDPTYFEASQLRGSGSAGRRVGKAVEHDGLALMRWVSNSEPVEGLEEPRVLESSFRFESEREQQRFLSAIDAITPEEFQLSVVQGTMNQDPNASQEGTR